MMLHVKLLTFVFIGVTNLIFVHSQASTVNPPGCGIRAGLSGQSIGPVLKNKLSLEDEVEAEEPEYDDTGMASRVIGGKQSTAKWPWMVAIFDEGYHVCGGSIIDSRHVLTAAHCFDENTNADDYEARIGELTVQDSGKVYQFDWIKVHPGYTRAPTFFNDIAVLKLKQPIPVDAVPICLPGTDTLNTGDSITITGFGATNEGGEASNTLQEVHNVPVMGTSKCDKIIRSLSPGLKGVSYKQICTGDEKGGKSSCQGDSGGPVVFQQNGKWWLVGLVSYSAGCARPGIPTVHTRVSQYKQWIERQISEGNKVSAPKRRFSKFFRG